MSRASRPPGSCSVAASATSSGRGAARRRRLRRATEERHRLGAQPELVGLARARARELLLAAEEEVAWHLVGGELAPAVRPERALVDPGIGDDERDHHLA